MKLRLTALFATAAALALPLSAHAVVYQFNATLNGANEVPPVATNGSGVATLSYDDKGTVGTADDTYSFSLSVLGLTGVATGMHIHAPAAANANAPVLVPLNVAPFVNFNSGGVVLVGGSNVAAPNAAFLGNLQASLAYVNVHTAAFGGGEVRGQLIPVAVVPEPSSLAMLLAGLGFGGLLLKTRARRQR